jgi:ApaG protein
MMAPAEANTKGIRIEVVSTYRPERSSPQVGRWFFTYTVRITNEGPTAATLRRRRWRITNANGHRHEVEGRGVVGREPRLDPGAEYSYTSACPLDTPFGSMAGVYEMQRDSGERFDAVIPEFVLAAPLSVH